MNTNDTTTTATGAAQKADMMLIASEPVMTVLTAETLAGIIAREFKYYIANHCDDDAGEFIVDILAEDIPSDPDAEFDFEGQVCVEYCDYGHYDGGDYWTPPCCDPDYQITAVWAYGGDDVAPILDAAYDILKNRYHLTHIEYEKKERHTARHFDNAQRRLSRPRRLAAER